MFTQNKLIAELEEAEKKAWDSLAHYKFWMFGYWAAWWVKLNRLSGLRRPNPFTSLVQMARRLRGPDPAPGRQGLFEMEHPEGMI